MTFTEAQENYVLDFIEFLEKHDLNIRRNNGIPWLYLSVKVIENNLELGYGLLNKDFDLIDKLKQEVIIKAKELPSELQSTGRKKYNRLIANNYNTVMKKKIMQFKEENQYI
jgi:hypothetical protein